MVLVVFITRINTGKEELEIYFYILRYGNMARIVYSTDTNKSIMTNGDKIRSMSDEELLALFCLIDSSVSIPFECCTRAYDAVGQNRDWLRQPYSENGVGGKYRAFLNFVKAQKEDSNNRNENSIY